MACPHNGSSITKTGETLFAIWYTLGGEEGLYVANSSDHGETFSPRKRLSLWAKHPYIASLGRTAIAVWDETFQDDDKAYRRVKMSRISNDGAIIDTQYLTLPDVEASAPYLLEMDNGNIIATWTQQTENSNELYYQRFSENPDNQFSTNN